MLSIKPRLGSATVNAESDPCCSKENAGTGLTRGPETEPS
jgi:hypothetical protein